MAHATDLSPTRLRRLLGLARRVTLRAMREVVAPAACSRSTRARRKAVGDFVTAVDVRAERRLRTWLGAADPDAGFLGEETGSRGTDRDRVWVVDPIDGTSNFARGLGTYAVAVACLQRGQPIVAAMWCEPDRCLYSAGLGLGAFRNGTRMPRPSPRSGDAAMIGCQWHRGQQRMGFLARLQRDGGRIRTLGSTVVQLAEVAMGRLDGNVQEQGRIWDLAAPGLLLVEAGGRLTDWHGKPAFPWRRLDIGHTPTVAAAPRMHARLLELLATTHR